MPFAPSPRLAALLSVILLASSLLRAQDVPAYRDPHAALEDRVEALFKAMTPQERLALLGGANDATSHGIPRLGVPGLVMLDATQGAHGSNRNTGGKATLFTSGVLLAASWDLDLAARIGHGVGVEVLNKGTGGQITLGPGLNILRSPLCGRNGEYIGGEDPFLASRLAVAYVRGMQETGCAACIKHYACNNQEFLRGIIDVRVDERALREIYTPAFVAAAREGQAWTAMSAYNQINGSHCSTNWYLLRQILKTEAGFDGLVMTDWFSAGSASESNDGCDLEMPNSGYAKPELTAESIKKGELTQANADDSARRILRTMIRVGLLDAPRQPDHSQLDTPAHRLLAREAAEKGIVLLKNQGNILPLDTLRTHSLALIGPACKNWQMGTGGSAHVDAIHSVSAYDGIVARAQADAGVKVSYDYGYDDHGQNLHFTGQIVPSSALQPANGAGSGLTAEYFDGYDFTHPPVLTRTEPQVDLARDAWKSAGLKNDHFCVRWTGTLTVPATGAYRFNLDPDIEKSGSRLYVNDHLIQDQWMGFDGSNILGQVNLTAGQPCRVRVEYVNIAENHPFHWTWLPPGGDLFASAVKAAREADVAVVFVGTRVDDEEEFKDRPSMTLPGVQDALIRVVAAANPRTVVVLNNGGPVLVSGWVNQVPGIVEAFFPAQEGGEALARILFGDVNPSGKLAYTMGQARENYPDYLHYPVRPGTLKFDHGAGDLANAATGQPIVDYAEGIYVGYRFFDKQNLLPSFPFGYGLSYTSFRYANPRLSKTSLAPSDKLTLTADITNVGPRAGAEVVQLYMQARQPKIDRPVRELKGFARVELQPGETRPVSFNMTARDLAYCDVPGKQWKADAGPYSLELGASSRDLRVRGDFQFSADYTDPLPGLGARSPYAP